MGSPIRLTDNEHRPTAAVVLAAMCALVGLIVLGAWTSRALFIVALIGALAVLGYAAWRWPRATLVGAILATLGDPYVLRGLVPAELHPLITGFAELLLVVVGAPIVVRTARAGRLVPALRDPVTFLALGYVAVALISAFINGVPPLVAVLGIVVTVDALAVYYLVRMLPFERQSVSIAIGALVGVTVLAALLGIAQSVLTPDILWFQAFAGRFGEGSRVTGFLGNPNLLAALTGFTLPFPLYATWHLGSPASRGAAIVISFILALSLVLTFSRGAWVAVVLGVGIGALIMDRRVLLVLAAVAVAGYLVAAYGPRDLLVDPSQRPAYGDDIVDSLGRRLGAIADNEDLRLRYIVEGMPIVLDHLLLGVGPGRYGGAVATITDSPVYAEYGASLYGYRTVHDFWLHSLGEVGVLGTTLILTMVIGLIGKMVWAARRARGVDRILLAGIATGGMVMTINNLTEMLLEGNFPAFAIWMLLGFGSLLAGTVLLAADPSRTPPRPEVA
jgi:O-antigen ligase